MAVLIEAISVVIGRETIDRKYPGGWEGFVENAPNFTLCTDGKIARLGFMTPDDVESFVIELENVGFKFLVDGRVSEIAVVDQIRGFLDPCAWLDAGHAEIEDGKHKVAVCKLKECTSEHIAFPDGWTYEQSLSEGYGFVPTEHMDKSLKYLRHENGLDIYLNLLTKEEVYICRTGIVKRRRS